MDIGLAVLWGPRREDVSKCALRADRHFAALAAASQNLTEWYALGQRKPKAVNPIDVGSIVMLESILKKGANRKDISRETISDLGFNLSLWNGDRGGWSSSTSIGCGKYSNYVSNYANVKIKSNKNSTLELSVILTLFRVLIDVWEPETGKVWQSYVPPCGGGDNTEVEEISYANYWVSSGRYAKQQGFTESFGRGQLWVSKESAWKTSID